MADRAGAGPGRDVAETGSAVYTIAMLAATRYRRAADLVADDPALMEVEVWRLFEVEGGGEDSLADHAEVLR